VHSRNRKSVALSLLCALICANAYAPIFGIYPGLKALEERSDAIAVIELLPRIPKPEPWQFDEKLQDWTFDPNRTEWSSAGMHWSHPVRVKSVLKGDVVEGRTTMSLRFLLPLQSRKSGEIRPAALDFYKVAGRAEYGCYLAFLVHDRQTTGGVNTWASLNTEGSLLAVPCSAEIRKRPGETPSECVRRLVGPE
jgi:hypothetical protein